MVQTGAGGMSRIDLSKIAEDIIPAADDTYDLGSDDKRWAYIFAVIAVLTSIIIGGVVSISTIDSWLFINASTMVNGSFNISDDTFIGGNLSVSGTNVSFPNANVTALYYSGDGSQLTGIAHGNLIFFLHNETSTDFPSGNILSYISNDTGQQTIAATITSDGFGIKNFTTNNGIPGLQIIPDGVAHFHFHAKKAAGTIDAQIYAKIYHVDTTNSSTLITTTELSDVLTGSSVSYDIHANIEDVLLSATDRLRILLLADVTGVGTDPQIEIYIEGNSGTRLEVPGPTASTANFVPYSGSTKNLIMGIYNVTADFFFGDGSQLTGITGDNASWNESHANTLYRDIAWDNFTGIPHATPSDGDTTHFSLADEIYDWAVGLFLQTTDRTNIAMTNKTNIFTANQNLSSHNITDIDCFIFDSEGKICSGV